MVGTATAAGRVVEVDAATVKRWLDAGEAVLFDVREADEHAREAIPGARLEPLSRLNVGAVAAGSGKRAVVHCKGGVRSMEAAQRVARERGCEVYSLKGGIEAWRKAGLPVRVNASAPIPIMRQVQIVAGAIVLVGTVLAATVSPWFLGLTGFVGAGLMFAGATGLCGMAAVLAKMPWNRVAADSCAPAVRDAGAKAA